MKKAKPKIDRNACRIITPEFRVSYPHLFTPQKQPSGDKLKFSVTMLFPKDQELIGTSPPDAEGNTEPRSIKKVIAAAKRLEFGAKENWPEKMRSPIGDGDDEEKKDKSGYAGHWIISASWREENPPQIFGPDLKPLTKASELYPGCYARAVVFAYVWEFMKKRGVGFILDGVQKTRDGEPFGGKRPLDKVFAPIESTEVDDDSDEDEDDEEDF